MGAEDTAREGGWVAKEEWVESGKDGDAWVTAGEFNRRGELLGFIKNQNKKLAAMAQTVSDLNQHNAKLEEIRLAEKESQLKAARREAIEEGDTAAVDAIDKPLEEVQAAKAKAAAHEATMQEQVAALGAPSDIVEELKSFAEKNTWYGTDRARTAAFNAKADEVIQDYPTGADLLNAVNKEITKIFAPEVQKAPKDRVRESTVDPDLGGESAEKNAARSKYSSKDLGEEQLAVARRLIGTGAFQDKEGKLTDKQRMQKYVDQLEDTGYFE